MEIVDAIEARARKLCEGTGRVWKENGPNYYWIEQARSQLEDEAEARHEPSGWAIFALAVGLALGGIGLLLRAVLA
jgi:hypothetical protein